jgi:hypothetical protein
LEIKANSDNGGEENTGEEFPGEQLEMLADKTLDKADISANDIIIVETCKPESGQFIFKFEDLANAEINKCEYCFNIKVMRVACKCKEVKYCSETCMKKDEKFHLDKCNAVDEDHDMEA